MTAWRMSFRVGNQGQPMWRQCLEFGVAAITYWPLGDVDLSRHAKGEPRDLWAQLQPAQKASLRRVAYEMQAGDIIYVKQGPQIVGKGVVKGPYFFDRRARIVDRYGTAWRHQVPVEWAPDFPTVRVLLGAEPLTVKQLTQAEVDQIESEARTAVETSATKGALEGEVHVAEVEFRRRNRALIEAKKAGSDYRCEVCGFRFDEAYGEIGRQFIIAHHTRPIASGPRKTTLDDIALLCANCHAMIHTHNPPITVEALRARLRRRFDGQPR